MATQGVGRKEGTEPRPPEPPRRAEVEVGLLLLAHWLWRAEEGKAWEPQALCLSAVLMAASIAASRRSSCGV